MLLIVSCVIYVIVSIILYVYFCDNPPHIRTFSNVCQKRSILLLTSHPDDECMFFSPTIIKLIRYGHSVRVLCLSTGNYENLGEIRQNELRKSCEVLGINKDKITIIDDERLPDNPELTWDPELICFYVYEQMRLHNINTIITFDEHGVSGHYNHKQTHRALWRALFQNTLPQTLDVYVLKTTNMLRKYMSILDLPLSLAFSDIIFVSSFEDICLAHEAMFQHKSQLVWFRKLYILFSRYMAINTLEPLSLSRPRKVPSNSTTS